MNATAPASDEQMLRRLYDALDDDDFESAIELTDPDVDWLNIPAGERVRGREAVLEHWEWLSQNFGVEWEVSSVESLPDGRFSVTIDQTVENHGGMLLSHGPVVHVLEVSGGRVVRLDLG